MKTIRKTKKPKIWLVGGGKGGTGKTFITSSIGTYLAEKRKKKVILIDADLGGANLHAVFGIKQPEKSLSSFFERKTPLEELVMESGIENLSLVPGDIHSLASDNIRYTQKRKLFRHINKLEAQHILMDVGGGSHKNILDAFIFADKRIAVITPEILAVENIYHFMKNAMFRQLRMTLRASGFKRLAQDIWSEKDMQNISTVRELVDFFRQLPETGPVVEDAFSGFTIYLILNKTRSKQDIYLGASIKSTFRKYLGVDTQYIGFLEYDDLIRKSVQEQKPFFLHHSTSRSASEIELFTVNLLRDKEIDIWED